jgi:hypothetical protein
MSKRLITILGPRLTNFSRKVGEGIDFSRIIPGGELQANKAALHEGEETRESLLMFPSYSTGGEPHRQRHSSLVVADVAILRNSLDELLLSPPPVQPVAFSSAVFSPIFFPFPLSAPDSQFLKSGVSDGAGA